MRVIRDRLAPLVPYMQDDSVNEIMINSHGNYFIESGGNISRVEVNLSPNAIDAAIRAVMTINSKDTSYIMDARLPGIRVACALPPVAVHGPLMTIRKHSRNRYSLLDYVKQGSFDRKGGGRRAANAEDAAMEEEAAKEGGLALANFLRWAVRSHKNILIAGGTGSGKTTLLSSCLMEIPDDERIITCEDTNEITLAQPNIVQLEAYAAPNATPITIRDLIRLCLRSRPDRIVVGEIRGQEAYDFLDAMNTGHSGSLCTIHADSAFLALRRLESLVRMSPTSANLPLADMRASIASAIHYVIYQARDGGVRAPEQVIALDGITTEGDYKWRKIYDRYD
jgi:P-type DNA transfer ATPase VirB11